MLCAIVLESLLKSLKLFEFYLTYVPLFYLLQNKVKSQMNATFERNEKYSLLISPHTPVECINEAQLSQAGTHRNKRTSQYRTSQCTRSVIKKPTALFPSKSTKMTLTCGNN